MSFPYLSGVFELKEKNKKKPIFSLKKSSLQRTVSYYFHRPCVGIILITVAKTYIQQKKCSELIADKHKPMIFSLSTFKCPKYWLLFT